MAKTMDAWADLRNVTQDDCQKMYPSFTVTCQRCQSTRVAVHNSLGFSAESGSWGSITFECADCENITEIVSP